MFHLNARGIRGTIRPVETTKITEVPMSRSVVPAGVVAALIATAVTLLLVCVPMSSVWFPGATS